MRGKHRVIVKNNKLHYEFEIKRNITIIQGDSATGKTTLIEMINQYQNLGTSSGIELICDVPCRTLAGSDWKMILSSVHENIIFIDEENAFIHTKEFAEQVKKADNYFVLITRENLYDLPYSVEEIYGIRSSGKYQNTNRIYQQMYQVYAKDLEGSLSVKPKILITEDSNSGYEFFKSVGEECGIQCQSAGGKSKIFSTINLENKGDEICVIADGAAIGPEMNRLYELLQKNENVKLYLPESFEWLILKSGIIEENDVTDVLDHPEDNISSEEYFSWERFFEYYLRTKTEGTYLQYRKSKLNEVYLHEKNKKAIMGIVADGNIIFE